MTLVTTLTIEPTSTSTIISPPSSDVELPPLEVRHWCDYSRQILGVQVDIKHCVLIAEAYNIREVILNALQAVAIFQGITDGL